ncbi:MAG: hypothetical protein L0J73_04320 [Halomonas sp.]|nr:hypothetical protein [Halomonas sp.]
MPLPAFSAAGFDAAEPADVFEELDAAVLGEEEAVLVLSLAVLVELLLVGVTPAGLVPA